MCGRFVMLTFDEVAEVIRSIQMDTPFIIDPDWPAQRPMAYPGSTVPIIMPHDGALTPIERTWGFEVDWRKGLVFNTRIETALGPKPGIWKGPIEHGRCVVATAGFFEPHATETLRSPRTGRSVKRQYLFESADSRPTFLAGVEGEGAFSVVTTEPNRFVAPVHDRMPLVLEPSEISLWLHGDFASLADRKAIELVVRPEDELTLPKLL